MVTDGRTDRAQLILIGAILLATVIFGLSLLLNSVLFVSASGDSGAAAAVDETDFVDFDVELGVRELVVRLNHGESDVTSSQLGNWVGGNVTNYSHALGESRARSGSVAVSVEYDNSSSAFGSRIIQGEDAELTGPNGNSNWAGRDPVPVGANARIGWFTLNVNLENSTSFTAIARNGSEDVELQFNTNSTHVRIDNGTVTTACEAQRDRVLLDLYSGTSFTDDCTFRGIGWLDAPSNLEFINGDSLEGKYAIVTNVTTYPGVPYDPCSAGSSSTPCKAPAVWSANVTSSVQGNSVSYENAYNLTVYTNER